MIVYFSGYGCDYSDPERFLGKKANVMLSYWASHKKPRPEKRFRGMRRARKRSSTTQAETPASRTTQK